MDSSVEKEIKRLRNLKNYKDYLAKDLEKIAWINIKSKEFKNSPLFYYTHPDGENKDKQTPESLEEQNLAEKKFETYLKNHVIESPSELDTLASLIYNEIFELRIQKELNRLASKNQYPPEKLTGQLVDVQNQKSLLKVKLGIDAEEKVVDDLTKLQKLEKRFEKYYQEHANEFTIVSGCCGKMLLLRRRVKDFDNMVHPWFAGRWFFNYEIIKDVKDGKLSKEDAWRYMSCSSQGGNYKPAFDKEYSIDYINYCIKNWHLISEHFDNKK